MEKYRIHLVTYAQNNGLSRTCDDKMIYEVGFHMRLKNVQVYDGMEGYFGLEGLADDVTGGLRHGEKLEANSFDR